MSPSVLPAALRQRRFLAGVLSGVLLVLVARLVINETPFADWLVRPLVRPDRPEPADVIVVLGAGLMAHCVPNVSALRRTLLAVRLWRDERAQRLIFSGGVPSGESCAVADVMADLAADLGVPQAAMVRERQSHSTRENAVNSAPLLRNLGARRVLIVSDRLHLTRAVGVFARQGFQVHSVGVPVFESHADNVSMLAAGLREYVALGFYRLRGWID